MLARREAALLARIAPLSLLVASFAGAGCPQAPPTLAELTTEIFEPRCSATGCHGATDPARALNLQSEAFAGLVGVASAEDPETLRVAPGDPEASLLYQVLLGPVGATRQMPAGAALSPEDVERVRRWIEVGAPSD